MQKIEEKCKKCKKKKKKRPQKLQKSARKVVGDRKGKKRQGRAKRLNACSAKRPRKIAAESRAPRAVGEGPPLAALPPRGSGGLRESRDGAPCELDGY